MSEHQDIIALEAEKKEWRDRLNNAFKDGGFVYDQQILEMLRQADFPIIVDLNNVLIGNNKPSEDINPKAKKFLKDLSMIGEVFIVTTARSWEAIWKILSENDLEKNIVLMVSKNYVRPDSELSRARLQNRGLIIDAYIDKIHSLGLTDEFEMAVRLNLNEFSEDVAIKMRRDLIFGGAPANKRLAPVFGKTSKIPLIDDGIMAVRGNPGVTGILAPYFESHPYDWENPEKTNVGRMTLEQIVEEVRKLKTL